MRGVEEAEIVSVGGKALVRVVGVVGLEVLLSEKQVKAYVDLSVNEQMKTSTHQNLNK